MLQHLKSLSVLIVLFLTLFISQFTYAQQSVPKGFNYQAIARDGDGAVYADQQLVVEITIRYGSTGDNIAWQEAHTVQTNEFGLFTLVIGEGMNTFIGSISSFDLIPWSSEDYFVGVKVDFGNGQLDMGAAQLKSVPYAVIADSALNFPFPKVEELADVNLRNLRLNMTLKWDGKQWVPGDTLLADYLFLTQDLTVDNKTYINSDLYVNDSITATTLNADKGDFDNLLVNQDAVIQNNLLVNNNTTIQNYLTANNDIIGNNDAYINDTITATTVDADMGDFDNLLVNINTTIQNDLLVNNDATVQNYLIINDDVMANTDLYVDDTVTATTVDATQGDFDYLITNFDATIQNNLTVNNSTTIQNDLIVNDNSYLNSDLYVSDTITATTIDATQGDFDYLLTNFNATIQNDLTVNNSITIQNDLIVNSNSYLNSDLYVNDSITATTIDAGKGDFDNLLVNQDANIQNDLNVNNSATILNDLTVSDLYVNDSITATTVDADLGDFENLVINQGVAIQTDLTVNGFATVQRELSVAEDINGSSDLYISDSITAVTVDAGKGDFDYLQVNQDATVQNNLYVTNQAFINGVLSLATGTTVNDISTSTTLGIGIGSDNTLVTQAAIKYYVNNTASTLNTTITTTESSLLTLVNQNKAFAEEHLDVTHGTVVANKAVIVDGNKDISGFRDVGIDRDLTIGGVLDLKFGTTINNISTEIDLGGGSPSNNAVPTQRAVKKYVDDLTSASGTNYVNIDGNTDLTGDWDIDGNDIIINNGDFVTTGSGDVYVADDFEVGGPNTDKFTIDGSNGNTYIDGTLEVNKATEITDNLDLYGRFRVRDGSTDRFKVDVGNGNTKVGGNLEVVGDFKVKSGGNNYFVVDKDNGNTDIRGNLKVNNGSTDRFFVDASNGNTTVYGTLTVIDDVTIANTKTLKFGTGNAISSFSTNTNLQISGSARDYALPTQLAVKTYIDAAVGGTAIWTESGSEANYAGNVGIGISNPACRLHVEGGSIWYNGNTGGTPTGNNIKSVRLMWIPAKAAFRAGEIATNANQAFWNNNNIGSHSTAFGKDTKASGAYSFATGQVSKATANYSFAIGESTTASGLNSISMGKSSDASGDYSAAFGNSTEASGESSIAVGSSAKATDDYAASFGESTEANGAASFAAGSYSIADGDYSVAIGSYAKSNTDYSVAFGQLSEAKGTHSVAIGKSCEAGSSGNNFSVAMGELSIASGAHSVAMGKSNTAATNFSVAMGESSATNGTHSVALGKSCTAGASGKNYSFAMGEGSTASGSHSFAMGSNSVASGDYSVVIGKNSIANGSNSVAIGDSLLTFNRSNLFVIGKFNSDSTDAAFVVGNGSSGSRNDALVLDKFGNLRISGNFSQSSDIRLKQNIVPLENVLNNIMQINPVYFEYIDTEKHPKGKQLGVIAQEIQKYYPELVREDGNGYLTVAYSNLNTVLFQAIKEQQEIINSLEKKLESQEARISALEK